MSIDYGSFVEEYTKIAFGDSLGENVKARPIPQLENVTVPMNIQRHDAQRAGTHYDLRIQDPDKPISYSWAIPKASLPQELGEKRLAIRQPDHQASYMGFSGDLKTRYGAGKVKSEFHDQVEVREANAGKVRFIHDDKEYLLHRTQSNKNWLIRRTQ
ncbi:MAG: hypothetical protein KDB07_03225 [Planctomycetes bacterium]|nr:hypothetical protein [Planctomycetota bacterium]